MFFFYNVILEPSLTIVADASLIYRVVKVTKYRIHLSSTMDDLL